MDLVAAAWRYVNANQAAFTAAVATQLQLSVLALAIALADLVLRLVEWTAGRRTGGPQAAPTTQR